MSLSLVQYTGDGSNKTFTIPFSYISQSHVKVYVDGVLTTAYTFPTSGSIQMTTAPASGAVVAIQRVTPIDSRMVDFQDGSTITEELLDLSANQTFYAVQEASDTAGNAIGLALDGTNDAHNKRIKNVADPVNAQDAVSKAYGDANYGGASAAAAAASASAASGYASAASASATAAATSASNAASSAASVVPVETATHAATSKATPVDADELPIVDSAASNVLKKLTWANLKATLKTYFDTLYSAAAAIYAAKGANSDITSMSALTSISTATVNFSGTGGLLQTGGGGLGYGTGSGGTVTQATSKATAVTLNKPTGQITMNNASLAAGATVSFQLVNSVISNTDVCIPVLANLAANYKVWAQMGSSGSCLIFLKNDTAGALAESPVINFAIIKGATA